MRTPKHRRFEILEHPADVGFLAYGATLEQLFENAALAMCSLAWDPRNIAEREERRISLQGSGLESLLFAWLAEILAISDAERLVFRRFAVTEMHAGQTPCRLLGLAYGEKFQRDRHRAGTYIKAVTYHQLAVEPTSEGWRARVFLDV